MIKTHSYAIIFFSIFSIVYVSIKQSFQQVVNRIDQPKSYLGYLAILGQKHFMYEANPEFMDQMGYMFLAAIKPILEAQVSYTHVNMLLPGVLYATLCRDIVRFYELFFI